MTAIITALIAGSVSLTASLVTYIATTRTLIHQRNLKERELERRFTEKLYELRLSAYPKAFSITDQLRVANIFLVKI